MDSLLNSYMNSVLENNLYKQNLQNHLNCSSCINCCIDSRKNYNVKDFSQFLMLIRQRSKSSPEAFAFSTKIKEKNICICSEYKGKKDMPVQQITVPSSTPKSSLQILLANEINNKSGDLCSNPKCDQQKTRCKLRVESLSNFIISLNWKSKSLPTLLNTLLSINSELNLTETYKITPIIHLQGMILSNSQTTVFITLNPCRLYTSIGNFTELDIKCLNFLIIYNSLFPSILIYNSSCEPSVYNDQSINNKKTLKDYLKFLSGQIIQNAEICYLCWSDYNQGCMQDCNSNDWICRCSYSNPGYCLFCIDCGCFKYLNDEDRECFVCCSDLQSNYCGRCSVVAQCWTCYRKILRTQVFGCPLCYCWTNSFVCHGCKKDLSMLRIQCCHCFNQNYGYRNCCRHGVSDRNCDMCMFEFTCASCFRPKLACEKKMCGMCLSEIFDGFCSGCKKYSLPCSYICIDCVYSTKKCHQNHSITKYSLAICKSCQKESQNFCNFCELKNHKCENIEQCRECEIPLNNSLSKICTLCIVNNRNHQCTNYQTCENCFIFLPECSCKSKILTKLSHCPNCSKIKDSVCTFMPEMSNILGINQWKCKNCGKFNENQVNFCELCDFYKENLDSAAFCRICGQEGDTENCQKCSKIGCCCFCKKDLLVSQRLYCSFCKSRVNDRACKVCKRVLMKTQILCYLCSIE